MKNPLTKCLVTSRRTFSEGMKKIFFSTHPKLYIYIKNYISENLAFLIRKNMLQNFFKNFKFLGWHVEFELFQFFIFSYKNEKNLDLYNIL